MRLVGYGACMCVCVCVCASKLACIVKTHLFFKQKLLSVYGLYVSIHITHLRHFLLSNMYAHTVEKDPHSQWRKLVWSKDDSLVAMGTS